MLSAPTRFRLLVPGAGFEPATSGVFPGALPEVTHLFASFRRWELLSNSQGTRLHRVPVDQVGVEPTCSSLSERRLDRSASGLCGVSRCPLPWSCPATPKLPEGEPWYPEESNLVLPGFNRALVPLQLEHLASRVASSLSKANSQGTPQAFPWTQ